MGYPTSVFSPTARSNGQTIDASHINDLQTEETAVQTALLGTITHSVNISGASTLATLQAAASTFTVRPVTPPPEAVSVYLTSTLALGSSGQSTLAFLGQSYLLNSSMHSTTTNPERLTPQSTGIYQISAQIAALAPSSLVREVRLVDSSNTIVGAARISNSTDSLRLNVTGYKRFDALGGYIRCLFLGSGSDSNSLSSGEGLTWFAMHKL